MEAASKNLLFSPSNISIDFDHDLEDDANTHGFQK